MAKPFITALDSRWIQPSQTSVKRPPSTLNCLQRWLPPGSIFNSGTVERT